jgi:hypothetical protein
VSRRASKALWRLSAPGGGIECRLTSGCGAAELVVERAGQVLQREAYPDSSTAYERARKLRLDYERLVPGPSRG